MAASILTPESETAREARPDTDIDAEIRKDALTLSALLACRERPYLDMYVGEPTDADMEDLEAEFAKAVAKITGIGRKLAEDKKEDELIALAEQAGLEMCSEDHAFEKGRFMYYLGSMDPEKLTALLKPEVPAAAAEKPRDERSIIEEQYQEILRPLGLSFLARRDGPYHIYRPHGSWGQRDFETRQDLNAYIRYGLPSMKILEVQSIFYGIDQAVKLLEDDSNCSDRSAIASLIQRETENGLELLEHLEILGRRDPLPAAEPEDNEHDDLARQLDAAVKLIEGMDEAPSEILERWTDAEARLTAALDEMRPDDDEGDDETASESECKPATERTASETLENVLAIKINDLDMAVSMAGKLVDAPAEKLARLVNMTDELARALDEVVGETD